MNFCKQFLLKIGKLKTVLPPALAGGQKENSMALALAKSYVSLNFSNPYFSINSSYS
jgi:hypothetical protein